MLTCFQIRTGRAALNMSVKEISNLTFIHPRTINRMENADGNFDDFKKPACRPINIKVIAEYFIGKGLIFSEDGRGVSIGIK